MAEPRDIPALLCVQRETPLAAQWADAHYRKMFDEAGNGRFVVFVLEDESKLIGFAAASEVLGEWDLQNIVIASEAQRRGWGERLLRELLDYARRRGALRMSLEVRESNLAALALYQKVGFRLLRKRKGYYRAPDEDAMVFELCAETGN